MCVWARACAHARARARVLVCVVAGVRAELARAALAGADLPQVDDASDGFPESPRRSRSTPLFRVQGSGSVTLGFRFLRVL